MNLKHPVVVERIQVVNKKYIDEGGKHNPQELIELIFDLPVKFFNSVIEGKFDPKNDPAVKALWKAALGIDMPKSKAGVEKWVRNHIGKDLCRYFELTQKRKT